MHQQFGSCVQPYFALHMVAHWLHGIGMLVGFTFPAFIYMKLGASGHAPSLSSHGSIVPSTGSLNESVTTASAPLLVSGTANRRDAVWILSVLLVCLGSFTVISWLCFAVWFVAGLHRL